MRAHTCKIYLALVVLAVASPCKAQDSKWLRYIKGSGFVAPQSEGLPGNHVKEDEDTITGVRDFEDLAGAYGQHFVNDRFMNEMRHDAESRLVGSADRGVLYSYRTYVFEGEGTYYESRSSYVGAGDDLSAAIKNRLYKDNLDALDEPEHYELDQGNSYGVLFNRDSTGNIIEILVPAWRLGTEAQQQGKLRDSLTSEQRSFEARRQAIDEERRSVEIQLHKAASKNRSTEPLSSGERSDRFAKDRRDTENTERYDRMKDTAMPVNPSYEGGREVRPLPKSIAPFARGVEQGRISAMTQAQTELSFAHLAGTNASADSLIGDGLIRVDPTVLARRRSLSGLLGNGIFVAGRGVLNVRGTSTGVGRGAP